MVRLGVVETVIRLLGAHMAAYGQCDGIEVRLSPQRYIELHGSSVSGDHGGAA